MRRLLLGRGEASLVVEVSAQGVEPPPRAAIHNLAARELIHKAHNGTAVQRIDNHTVYVALNYEALGRAIGRTRRLRTALLSLLKAVAGHTESRRTGLEYQHRASIPIHQCTGHIAAAAVDQTYIFLTCRRHITRNIHTHNPTPRPCRGINHVELRRRGRTPQQIETQTVRQAAPLVDLLSPRPPLAHDIIRYDPAVVMLSEHKRPPQRRHT